MDLSNAGALLKHPLNPSWNPPQTATPVGSARHSVTCAEVKQQRLKLLRLFETKKGTHSQMEELHKRFGLRPIHLDEGALALIGPFPKAETDGKTVWFKPNLDGVKGLVVVHSHLSVSQPAQLD